MDTQKDDRKQARAKARETTLQRQLKYFHSLPDEARFPSTAGDVIRSQSRAKRWRLIKAGLQEAPINGTVSVASIRKSLNQIAAGSTREIRPAVPSQIDCDTADVGGGASGPERAGRPRSLVARPTDSCRSTSGSDFVSREGQA